MFRTPHVLTDGEKKCLEPYWEETKGQAPRKNLIKLVRHINMFNPVPDENSWEYIFFNRQLSDAQVDFALKMKHRHAVHHSGTGRGRKHEHRRHGADGL